MSSQERKALTKRLEDLAPRLIESLEAIAFGDGRKDEKIKAISFGTSVRVASGREADHVYLPTLSRKTAAQL